ncbi:MAG: hypothetical protein DMF51_10870 [Acidobacteria bacterium]|nr:MAG: hypothetical protein DMF51_10870 [Acidobacteriota bacterium]
MVDEIWKQLSVFGTTAATVPVDRLFVSALIVRTNWSTKAEGPRSLAIAFPLAEYGSFEFLV